MSESISLHDDLLRNRIRTLYLEGLDVKQIQDILEVPAGTWDVMYWRNDKGFRDHILACRAEYAVKQAENYSKELMARDDEKNARLATIKQKEAEFLRETLGKHLGYTKRSETLGALAVKQDTLNDEQRAKLDEILGKHMAK